MIPPYLRVSRLPWCCINTAVEATSLNSRSWGMLLEQDEFIRDTIRPDDVLVVSIGGNGIVFEIVPSSIF